MRTIGKCIIIIFWLTVIYLCPGVFAEDKGRAGGMTERFRGLDKNGDGKLNAEELPRPRLFQRFDKNGDGFLTLEELLESRLAPSEKVTSDTAIVTTRDLAYGKHKAQRLDVYAPKDAKGAPVMVYVHGGGWSKGDKARVGQKAEFFTGKDWVFVSINYRLLPEGKHPSNVEDVAVALAWVHSHIKEYGGDPDSIFLMGHSAGGHLVSLVATDEQQLKKAGKSLSILKGIIALDTQAYDIPQLMEERSPALYLKVFGEKAEVQKDASPIHYVAKGKAIPPFLIFFSRGNSVRPNPGRKSQAEAFAAALKASGIAAEVVDASDRSHSEINQRFGDAKDRKVTGKAMAFLNNILTNATKNNSDREK